MKKILGLIFIILVGSQAAFADTCATNLMPAFTNNQATALCTKFGDSIAESLIPQSDNSIDLGSASKTWRTLYTGTSRIAKTSDILRVRQDAQRLFTWDASSDTAFTWTFGDAGVTAAQGLIISGSTADADDDSSVCIGGGGTCAGDFTRGGEIYVYGNESAAAGDINIFGGSAAGSNIRISSGLTAGGVTLEVAGTAKFTVANTVNTSASDVAFATNKTVSIQEATAGTACSGTLTANGATPVVTSTTCALTGSRIFLSRTSAETGTVTAWVSALTDATSFAITSEAADTGTYNWIIFHEAP